MVQLHRSGPTGKLSLIKFVSVTIGYMLASKYTENDCKAAMFEKKDLLKIANLSMPFGKYKGRILIDLPEDYLLWFANKGFPSGDLGRLLALTLEIQINGLEPLIHPLKNNAKHLSG